MKILKLLVSHLSCSSVHEPLLDAHISFSSSKFVFLKFIKFSS